MTKPGRTAGSSGRRRLLTFILACPTLAGAGVMLTASPVRAAAPQEQGWWTFTNPGTAPFVGATVPTPPSDVPKDGLLIQGGPTGATAAGAPDGYTAFAAVVYDLNRGDTASQLTLPVAPQSASTPTGKLELCPLVNPTVRQEEGGPLSDAPDFNCATKTTAGPDSSGKNYTFSVSNLVAEGTLAVAILPADPTTRVVLSKPGSTSLQTLPGASTSVPTGTGVSTGTTGSSTGTSTSSGSAPSAGSGTSAGGSSLSLPSASSGSSVTSSSPTDGQRPVIAPSSQPSTSGSQPVNSAPVAAITDNSKRADPAAVAALLAILAAAAGLWALAGRRKLEPGPDGS